MTRHWIALASAFGLLAWMACTGSLDVDHPPDDDDNDVTDDDDDATDDDATDDDDSADDDTGDDDDTTSDDDTGTDDDTTSDDDTEEPCCTDLEWPGYAIDDLVIDIFLESDTYNEFLSVLLADALPPDSDSVIILFDPDGDPTGQPSFDSRFGVGVVNEDLYDYDTGGGSTPTNWTYIQGGNGFFETVDDDLTLLLSFGVTVPLYQAGIEGVFSPDYENISDGAIFGAILEEDTLDINTSFGELHDLMDGRTLDVDVSGNGTPDAWSFRMEFGAFQFVS